MANYKRFMILSVAFFVVSVYAQLRGSNTEDNGEDAIVPVDVPLDAVSIIDAQPSIAELDAAVEVVDDNANVVDESVGDLADDVEYDVLADDSFELEDSFDDGTEHVLGVADSGLVNAESAEPGLVGAQDVDMENGGNDEELIVFADTASGDDVDNVSVIPNTFFEEAGTDLNAPEVDLVDDGVANVNVTERHGDFASAANVELAEALLVPEYLVSPTEVPELGNLENAEFVAALEELAEDSGVEGLASADNKVGEAPKVFGVAAEIEMPTIEEMAGASEGFEAADDSITGRVPVMAETVATVTAPTIEEMAGTLEGFDVADNSVTGRVPEMVSVVAVNLPPAETFESSAVKVPVAVAPLSDISYVTAETSFPSVSIVEAEIPRLAGGNDSSNEHLVNFETGLSQAANTSDTLVVEERNELARAIDAGLDILTNVDKKRFPVAEMVSDAIDVDDEGVYEADNTVSNLITIDKIHNGRVINFATGPSGFQSFLVPVVETQPVDLVPVVETITSGSQAIAAPFLEAIVAEEAVTETSNELVAASEAHADAEDDAELVLVDDHEDHESHEHDHDHEGIAQSEELGAVSPRGSAAIHNYPSIVTLLVAVLACAGAFF